MSKVIRSLRRVCIAAGLSFFAVACGGGGGGSSSAPDTSPPTPPPTGSGAGDEGELIIGITDAPGDFISYAVDVESLTLTSVGGDVVQALPISTRVDFAELTEVTELLSIATVPAGTYRTVSVQIDFSDADIIVQDDDGNAVAAQAVDGDGAALGVFDMRLELTTTDAIRIAPGRPAAFSLDFDLDASNEVDLATAPVEVTVEPFLLATPELEQDREHRVRGVISDVRVDAEEIDLRVRPFRHRTGQFGRLTVMVDAETAYDVDNEGFTGEQGLQATAALAENSPLIAMGNITDAGYMAHTILAGSSVPWSDADVVVGVVTARVGDVLTVSGGHVEFADGTRAHRGTFSVTVTQDTEVSAPGNWTNLSTQSLSVGQRVTVWGEFSDDVSVTANRVRMHLSQLSGEVVQAQPLALDLVLLNARRPATFDFSGTGISGADDSDPAFYEIDTGALSLTTVENGDLLRVRGRVNDFGAAPADFTGRTIVDLDLESRSAHLAVGWEGGTAEPFSSIASSRIEVNLIEARKALKVRGIPRDFIDELENVALVAPDRGTGVYSVKVRGANEFHVYRNFADLVDELMAQLDAGRVLHRIHAAGSYNVQEMELTARRAGFVFSAPAEGES